MHLTSGDLIGLSGAVGGKGCCVMAFEVWIPFVFIGLAVLVLLLRFEAGSRFRAALPQVPGPAPAAPDDAAMDDLDFVDGAPPSGAPPAGYPLASAREG